MADADYLQSNFLGGQWSPNAQGRVDHPQYRTALALSLNGLPVEEGAWTRRSGTRDHGNAAGNGQVKEFYLPGNLAVVLEITPNVLAFWMVDATVGYRRLAATFATSWSTVAVCKAVRVVQADGTAYLLASGYQPMVLTCTNYLSAGLGLDPAFTFAAENFTTTDGPYADALAGSSQTGNSLGSVTGPGASLSFSITDAAYSFVSTDLNRAIRLWSQPPVWSATASYAIGAVVTFAGTYWSALVGGSLQVGVQPGAVTQPPANSTTVPTQGWALSPTAANWAWGYITAVTNSTTVVVTLTSTQLLPTAANGLVIDTWQIGLFTAAIWPTCGAYQSGRVWFGGAMPNRIDASVADSPTNPASLFSPTDEYGNVLDDSAIAAPLNLSPASVALWMMPDYHGVLVGTASGEQLVTASALNDPLTPTSIDVRPETTYKSQNAEPVRAGMALVFIQGLGRRVMEYVVDVFSQRSIGRHLNEFAKDLTVGGLQKVVYQEELAPVVWVVTAAGGLIGCTYRRVSHFGSEGPLFNGWHQHTLGSGRPVSWACIASAANGLADTLALLTADAEGGYHLETMQPLFDVGQSLTTAWPLDSAFSSSQLSAADNGTSTLTVSGLPIGTGNTDYAVWIGGLYAGTYQVNSGTVAVPYGSDPDGYLTAAYLQGLNGSWGELGVSVTAGGQTVSVPLVVGFAFTSQVQTLRPTALNDVRTPTGPGLAKTRRHHMYGLLLANTVTGLEISVDTGPVRPITLTAKDRATALDHTALYSGVWWDVIDDDNSFDGQVLIQRSDPYPLTIAAFTGFLHTQDR